MGSGHYDDGPPATYTYRASNKVMGAFGLVETCNDVRYAGPMKQIKYEYLPEPGPTPRRSEIGAGQIWRERNVNVNGPILSEVTYPDYHAPNHDPLLRTETRADNFTRSFQYYFRGEFLARFSDFDNHWSDNTRMPLPAHDGSYRWDFRNARGYTTQREFENVIGAIKLLRHPDNSTILTTYSSPAAPYYVASRTDENNHTTSYLRDDLHRIYHIDYPGGGSEGFTYSTNGFGQIETHTMTSGGIEHFQYDARGLKTLYWPPSTLSDPYPEQHKTQYFYYDANNSSGRFDLVDRLWYVIDPLGHTTTYDYNMRGQVTRVTHHDGTFSQSHYNDDGTLDWTADENHPTDPNQRTRYEYDDYKRVTRVVNPLGKDTRNDYTPLTGNLSPLSHTTSSVYLVTSLAGKLTEYDYDKNFRRKRTTQAPNNTSDIATTTFTYDEVGNTQTVTEPNGQPGQSHAGLHTTFGYDNRNRQTTVTNALQETTTVEYDSASNKTKETRQDGTFRAWGYDTMNRLWLAIDWRASTDQPVRVTTYVHDFAGNVHSITDAKGAVYVYEYDELNRKKSATYPTDASGNIRTETWHYDFAGNLDYVKNPADQYKNIAYDSRNRPWHSWWNESVGPAIVTRYDGASRVIRILANSAHTGGMAPDEISAETMVSFGYDDANRKVWEEQTLAGHPTRRIQTDLNDDGTRQNLKIVDPQGNGPNYFWPKMQGTSYWVNYDYTARNQLKTISAENWSFNYIYDPSGNMTTRRALYNGNVSSSTNCPEYDALNRPMTWEQSTSYEGVFVVNNYQYDNVNREVATWRADTGLGERFTYEPTNQLASAAYNGHVAGGPPTDATRTVIYGYTNDKLNRSSVTDNNVVTSYMNPSGINQYGSVGQATYSYDNNFNLTVAGALQVTYDAANHVVSAVYHDPYTGDNNVQLVYDGLGRCVKRTINGYAAVFAYDDWKPIAEWDEWNGCQAWNVYGPGADEILLRYQTKYGYIRFQLDRHGNVAFLIDNDGHGLEKYKYDVFGRSTITGWLGGNEHLYSYYSHRFQFQGRDYIHELGIYDYRHRFYHPALGRFLQTDPTGFGAGDMNLFRYVGDDPVDGSDPLGLEDLRMWPERHSDLWPGAEHRVFSSHSSKIFDIAAHGKNGAISDESGNLLTKEQLISRAERANPQKFRTAEEIKFWVCDAGKGNNPIAKKVAQAMGKRGSGPDNRLWEDGPNGVIAPPSDWSGRHPSATKRGNWITFGRDGSRTVEPNDNDKKSSRQNETSRGEGQSSSSESGNITAHSLEGWVNVLAGGDVGGQPGEGFHPVSWSQR